MKAVVWELERRKGNGSINKAVDKYKSKKMTKLGRRIKVLGMEKTKEYMQKRDIIS